MRFISTLLSLCLHLLLVIGMIYWPASSSKVRLDVPVYQVKLVALSGKRPVGKVAPGNKVAGPVVKPKPEPSPATPPPPAPEPAPAPAPAPKPQPAAKPVPAPKPEPKPDATPISPKKAVVPEAPKVAEQPKPKDDKKDKPDKKSEPDKKPEPQKKPEKKPEKSADDILREALADTSKTIKKAEKQRAVSGQQQISKELAALQESVSQNKALQDALAEAGEEGIEGPPSDGVVGSIEDLYAIAVQNLVKKNWRFPQMATRDQLTASVRIMLSPEGSILDAKIVASSGRADFDASTLRAVADTKVLPKPPSPDISEITINFNSHE